MTTISLPKHPDASAPPQAQRPTILLIGNPNAGKTSLFNQLTGLRAKTANFPGTTVEYRKGIMRHEGMQADLIDLPGLYNLTQGLDEERISVDAIAGKIPSLPKPSAIILLIDASRLERNLFLASQVIELGVPTVIALNMIDIAHREGIGINKKKLCQELGCPVVPIVALNGWGVDKLTATLQSTLRDVFHSSGEKIQAAGCSIGCSGCPFQARYDWAEEIGQKVTRRTGTTPSERTQWIDQKLTHPVLGVMAFMGVMFVVFLLIFWIAQYPMDMVEWLFEDLGGAVTWGIGLLAAQLPAGWLQSFLTQEVRSLLVDGIIGGVGGILVFLPQIGILFFLLSLLEDTGYMARAAFVMDRMMRRVGLPGKAFVSMLSAHACAVPAIMSTRAIEDKRDRLVSILVLPLLSCSARIPIYAMIVALLFPHQPVKAAVLFTGAYLLGIVAMLVMALLFKRTILPGETRPLILELPSYKLPSLKNAFRMMIDRSMIFIRKAGTIILIASIALWILANYPYDGPSKEAVALQTQAQVLENNGQAEQAAELQSQADHLITQDRLDNSFAGMLGHAFEPITRPLGFDWRMNIGIISSFAAREVFVSTMSIVYGVGAETADNQPALLYDTLKGQKRQGSNLPVFDMATCVSLLIFYVLAMQCMSTLATTKRETGGWKWPVFQFAYMTVLAYGGSLVAFQVISALAA